jgi:GT2 family glycosyltransferase
MKLSVVILNYNVRYFLEICLKSVEAATKDIDAEVIVVDNNSSDDSCKMVSELFPAVNLISNKENSGFSKGNNIGVDQAQGEYLCILNPDTIVAEDTFLKLISFSEKQNNLGAVGCQLIDGRGKFLPESKRNIPYPIIALKKVLGNTQDYYANHLKEHSKGKVEILVGAFMFLKKEVYTVVGGFDEDYFMYGEDIDLSYKILKAGYDNYYYGETSVIHFKGESTLKDATYAKRFYGAMQIFYHKHFKRNLILNSAVWLGIKLAYRISKSKNSVELPVKSTIVFSKGIESSLENQLPKPITVHNQITDKIDVSSMTVYDFNVLSFKDVITDMKKKSSQEHLVFRFLPKNSKFILGSDSAIGRGEVLHF